MTLPIKLESVYDGGSTEIATIEDGVITIGRHNDNTIVINSNSVSRNHGELRCAQSHWVFKDLGSTNGTFINDSIVPAGKLKLIRDANLICLSNFHVSVTYLGAKPADYVNSLLIFHEDKFFSEYFPRYNEDVFYAGGDNHQILVEGEDPHTVQFLIKFRNDAFSIQVFQVITPILLNGHSINNFTNLKDGDEIIIGNLTIIVNSQRAVEQVDTPSADAITPKSRFLGMELVNEANSANFDSTRTAAFVFPEQGIGVIETNEEDYDDYNGNRLDENNFSQLNNNVDFVESTQQTNNNSNNNFLESSASNNNSYNMPTAMSGWAAPGAKKEPINEINKFSRSEMVFDDATPTTESNGKRNVSNFAINQQNTATTAKVNNTDATKQKAVHLNVAAVQKIDRGTRWDKIVIVIAVLAIVFASITLLTLVFS